MITEACDGTKATVKTSGMKKNRCSDWIVAADKGVQLMQKRKSRIVEWNSCIDVPLVRGVLVQILLLDRCNRTADKRATAHADLLVGAQVLADQCKQSAGEDLWVSPISNYNRSNVSTHLPSDLKVSFCKFGLYLAYIGRKTMK